MHAAHASQLRSCNYYVCVPVGVGSGHTVLDRCGHCTILANLGWKVQDDKFHLSPAWSTQCILYTSKTVTALGSPTGASSVKTDP